MPVQKQKITVIILTYHLNMNQIGVSKVLKCYSQLAWFLAFFLPTHFQSSTIANIYEWIISLGNDKKCYLCKKVNYDNDTW